MIIDFIIEDLMLNSYLQKNFHTLMDAEDPDCCRRILPLHFPSYSSIPDAITLYRHRSNLD